MVPSSSVAISRGNQRAALLSLGDFGQELRLDLGRIIDTGWHTISEQLNQVLPFTLRRILQQFDEFPGLLSGQRQRRDTKRSALGNMGTIGFQHGNVLSQSLGSKSAIVLQGRSGGSPRARGG
jgi:hypothetical protein